MKIRHLTFFTFLFFFSITLQAQLPFGEIGEDFTVTDIDDNTYTLYDILDSGKSVILDFSATWCGPCWNYHQTHILQDLYDDYGPDGSDEIEIFMLEADFNTNTNCLYGQSGCNSTSLGDWTAGITYPIVNLSPSNGPNVKYDYELAYYPTLYKICPNRKVYEVGQAGLQTWINWISSCDLAATGTATDAVCFDDENAGVDLTATGGFGSLTYSWSNSATTEDIFGIGPGSYSCTITEGNGHKIEAGPFVVDGPSAPLEVAVLDQQNINCNGDNDGYINIEVLGGGPGYSYLWSNNATTQNINNLGAGSYSVTVTDDFGCTEMTSTAIFEPPALNLDAVTFNENCDQGDGAISLFAWGGTGSYLYDIGYGPTSNSYFDNLSAGVYNASVTDDNNCIEVNVTVIGNVPPPIADAGEDETISCDVDSIELDGTGSSDDDDITYTWSTDDGNIVSGGDTPTPIIDQPGTYEIAVLDIISGCESYDTVLVEGVNAPVADAGDDDELNCDAPLVTLDGSNSSMGDSIVYEWLNENDDIVSNDSIVDVDTSGVYRLVVLNTSNNCSKTDSVVITENFDTPVADAGDGDELNCDISTVTLDGSNSSSGDSIVYEWLNENNDTISNDSIIDVDVPGTFRLFVYNTESGCSEVDSVIVTEDVEIPIADAGQDDDINCDNPTITLDGSNSSSGDDITYEWFNEDDEVISTDISAEADTAGSYRLVVYNAGNGCSETDTVVISENLELPIADAGEDDELNCTNTSSTLDGSNSSSGDNISYEWLDENDEVIGTDSIIDVENPGTYRLLVLNTENGCFEQDTVIITQNVEEPVANAGDGGELTCTDPTITLDGSDSSTGDEFTYEWVNSNGNVISNDISVDVSTEDNYTFTVINIENGCTSSDIVEVTASTEFPDAVVTGDDDLTCTTTNITLDGSDSSTGDNFSYEWLDSENTVIGTELTVEIDEADTYTLVVSDNDNGCTASTDVIIIENTTLPEVIIEDPEQLNCINENVELDGSNSNGENLEFEWLDDAGVSIGNSSVIEVSDPGNYNLIVTNTENGCTSSSQTIVYENVEIPNASAEPESVLDCEMTTTTIDGSGSSTGNNFAYEWTTQDGNIIEGENTLQPMVDQAGTYSLIVTNTENGCTATTQTEVESNAQLPTADAGNDSALHCNLSSLDLDGSNSSTGQEYSYNWDTDNGNIVDGGNTLSPTIDAAGIYILTVLNNETGCSQSATVEVVNIPAVEIEVETIQDVTCFGESNGSVTLNINGGLEPYSYEWSNGTNDPIAENLQAGTYDVTVSDINDCSTSTEITISEPDDLVAQISDQTDVECATSNDGTATVIANGGNGSYTYEWSNGASTASVDNLNAGEFSVTITDENGCNDIVHGEIIASDYELPTVITQNFTIPLDENGFAVLDASMVNDGSFDNCSLASLSIDQNLFDCNALGEQTVMLSATDGSGNSASAPAIVTIIDDLAPTIICADFYSNSCSEVHYTLPEVSDNCSAELVLTGGLPSGAEFPEGQTEISYMATDPSGNSVSCSFIVIVEYDLTSTIEGTDVTCANAADGSATAVPNGGTPGYSYEWSDGQTTQTANDLGPGLYSATTTDATGCESEQDIMILEPDPIEVVISEIINENEGNGDGEVHISVFGGIGPFTYDWILDGQVVSTDEDLEDASAGEYQVIVTDANGCTLSSETIVIENVTAVINPSLAAFINIQPNPTSGKLFVLIELPESLELNLSVFSVAGKQVLKSENETISTKQYELDLSNFASGIYILKITTENGVYTEKVVLERM